MNWDEKFKMKKLAFLDWQGTSLRVAGLEMVVFDLDGVLVDINSSWQMVHEAFGADNEVNFQKHLRGQIDFKEFMRSDIALWGHSHISHIKKVLDKAPLMGGTVEALKTLKEAGYKTAIISSGISLLAERVKDELGIDYCFSNRLLTDEDGMLTGEGEEFVRLLNKDKVLDDLVSMAGTSKDKCVVVGDSRYDVPLFRDAGLSVAFNSDDDVAKAAADLVIDKKDLTEILPWLVNNGRTSMAVIIMTWDDEKVAKSVVKAVAPDNSKLPAGLLIKTVRAGNTAVTKIVNIKGVETLLATIDDLFSCSQVAEKVVDVAKNL